MLWWWEREFCTERSSADRKVECDHNQAPVHKPNDKIIQQGLKKTLKGHHQDLPCKVIIKRYVLIFLGEHCQEEELAGAFLAPQILPLEEKTCSPQQLLRSALQPQKVRQKGSSMKPHWSPVPGQALPECPSRMWASQGGNALRNGGGDNCSCAAAWVNMAKTQMSIHGKPLSEATSEKLKILSYPFVLKKKKYLCSGKHSLWKSLAK